MAKLNGLERLSSQPFLTDDQRAALDAALARKRAEEPAASNYGNDEALAGKPQLGKNVHSDRLKTRRELEHDHHLSRRGRGLGRPKKAGAGGKYTWGGTFDVDQDSPSAPLDKGDPNYDSDLDESVALVEEASAGLNAYKRAVIELLEEYFSSGEVAEASLSLKELDRPQLAHWFVKKSLLLAFDRHHRERESVSVLLSSLYGDAISPQQLRAGFAEAVASLEDTKLDVPDAPELLSMFTCRAVADDILPPAFVRNIGGEQGSAIADFTHKCEALLSDKHFAERMQRCWGLGAGLHLADTKESIASALKEYSSSGDVLEVERLLRSLAVPFFHHEAVKQALLLGIDATDFNQWAALFASLSESGLVSVSQMTKGFQRVADNLDDIELDSPNARERFAAFMEAAKERNWVEEGFEGEPSHFSKPNTPRASPLSTTRSINGTTVFHPSVGAYKKSCLAAVREYFESGDAQEVARQLQELGEPAFAHIFIKQAVAASLDRRDRERELISILLPKLLPLSMPEDQVSAAFARLLVAADDLALDIPEAGHMLALFLARAIADEVLPPRFLTEVLSHLDAGSLGVEVVQASGGMLSARHAGERLASCWHSSARGGADALASAFSDILAEYESSQDATEAERCILELGVPHFHHEFVYKALVKTLGEVVAWSTGDPLPAPVKLLARLAASGEVNQTQMARGFERAESRLDDLCLDNRNAPILFGLLKKLALESGWIV